MNRHIVICASSILLVTLVAIGSLHTPADRMMHDGAFVPIDRAVVGHVSEADDEMLRPSDRQPPSHRGRDEVREVTPELAEHIIEIAHYIDESLAERLRELCDANPQEFERVVRSQRRLLALVDLKEQDPTLFELKKLELQNERQMTMLARHIAEARDMGDTSREESLRQDLLTNMRLSHAFSIRARQQYLERLEKHLEALRAEIERDTKEFDAVVDRRMEEEIHKAERTLAAERTAATRRP